MIPVDLWRPWMATNKLIGAGIVLALGAWAYAVAAESDAKWIETMAVCEDSWYEWRDSSEQIDAWQSRVNRQFVRRGRQFNPRSPIEAFGYPVLNLSPDRYGLAKGFAVIVDGPMSGVRDQLKSRWNVSFEKCKDRGCRDQIAPEKTRVLRPTRSGKQTVIGCVYEFRR